MKHEKLTGEILGAAMAVLNFKEAKLAWKRVVRGPAEAETGSRPRITRISRIERDVLAPGGRSPG
jgi:hypothetical protein